MKREEKISAQNRSLCYMNRETRQTEMRLYFRVALAISSNGICDHKRSLSLNEHHTWV